MQVEELVRPALASDPAWSGEAAGDGREGDRGEAIDVFEEASGLRLPEAYRYLAVHHPTNRTSARLFTDVDRPTKREVERFGISLRKVELIMRNGARMWAEGSYMLEYLGDPPEAARVWAPKLFPAMSSGDDLVMFDFRFDRENPPLVLVQSGVTWANPAPRAKVVFVADGLLEFFGLEIATEENHDGTPADEPTARQVEWTQWRDRELIPACQP